VARALTDWQAENKQLAQELQALKVRQWLCKEATSGVGQEEAAKTKREMQLRENELKQRETHLAEMVLSIFCMQ
jgi:hypothetical protein